MRILLTLLLCLVSGYASAQAVAPRPASPFVYVAPPEVSSVPVGAGASQDRLVGPGEKAVERSPNKRVLPPSNEPGLWAADAVRASAERLPSIAGVEFPYPESAVTATERAFTNSCAASMNKALGPTRALVLSAPERGCLAARLLFYCAQARFKDPHTRESENIYADLTLHAGALQRRLCERNQSPTVNEIFNDVTKTWSKQEGDL